MNHFQVKSKLVAQLVFLAGLSMWITVITINNITDSGTNTLFIKQLLTMSLFDRNSLIGEHLLWRTLDISWLPSTMLWFIVVIEVIIDVLIWSAFFKCFRHLLRGEELGIDAFSSVNIALTAFMALFLLLISGGMWFGYWLHQGAFQMVHLTAIILSMLGLIYNNQNAN